MNTPSRTTAAAFPRYLNGEILADSRSLQWSDLYVRHCRFPRVVDRFLVPATAEPHISCTIVGSAEFLERDPGGRWFTHHIRRGDIFVTRSRTPYEVRFRSPAGEELETIAIHVGIDSALASCRSGRASATGIRSSLRFPTSRAMIASKPRAIDNNKAPLPPTNDSVRGEFD